MAGWSSHGTVSVRNTQTLRTIRVPLRQPPTHGKLQSASGLAQASRLRRRDDRLEQFRQSASSLRIAGLKSIDGAQESVPDRIHIQVVVPQDREQIAFAALKQLDQPVLDFDVTVGACLAKAGGFGQGLRPRALLPRRQAAEETIDRRSRLICLSSASCTASSKILCGGRVSLRTRLWLFVISDVFGNSVEDLMKLAVRQALSCSVLILAAATAGYAQSISAGTIEGTVTDPTGAAMAITTSSRSSTAARSTPTLARSTPASLETTIR